MKKTLILTTALLMTSLLSEAQNPSVCQPDSVKYYINMAEYPSSVPIDSVGWIKFSYDENGLLTHYRREAFSEELWSFDDRTFEYDSCHNLTGADIRRDAFEAKWGAAWRDEYTYQGNNQLSTYADYYNDPHSMNDNPWCLQDSMSFQYDTLGRISKKWEFCTSTPFLHFSDYEYQDNEVTVVTQRKYGSLGECQFLNKRTLLYSDNGRLLSCLLETANDTSLTTYSYNEQGLICGILKQKLQNDVYVNTSRVVFELNETGYPSAVSFEKWEEQWVEGYNHYSLPHLRNTDDFFVFSESYLAHQNYLILLPYYVKRLELYYSQTPKPDYDVMEQSSSASFATVHPNPTTGQITVTGKALGQAEVFNAVGQRTATATGTEDEIKIDLHQLPAGVYFVNVTDAEGRKCMKKVVKE